MLAWCNELASDPLHLLDTKRKSIVVLEGGQPKASIVSLGAVVWVEGVLLPLLDTQWNCMECPESPEKQGETIGFL
jgi:hypothetical protein